MPPRLQSGSGSGSSSSVPPVSQPLHRHFKAVKKTASTPTSDTECNPFLGSTTKTLPSSSLKSTSASSSRSSNYIQPTSNHNQRGSRKLPLSDHHSTLLSLHSAVEHALIVHLATSGGNAADSSSTANSQIQLPNVITFATLQPIVERSCGRRLGSSELAKLMWLWGDCEESNRPGCNIGFHVSRGKTMDRVGNKSYDYYLSLEVGVDLPDSQEEEEEEEEDREEDGNEAGYGSNRKQRKSIEGIPSTPPRKRARLLDLPEEPQTPSPSPRSISTFARHPHLPTPPSSPSMNRSPNRSPMKRMRTSSGLGINLLASPGRVGSTTTAAPGSISLVATWNSGIESRKREVRRRLVKWTVDCYETWKREENSRLASQGFVKQEINHNEKQRPCTPPPTTSRRAIEGQGGTLTPSATREDEWVPGQKRVKDFFAEYQGEERKGRLLRDWDPAFPLNRVAPTPEARLPECPSMSNPQRSSTLSSTSTIRMNQKVDAKQSSLTSKSATTSTSSMSLTDRIKAKEAAKRSQLESRSGLDSSAATLSDAQCRSTVMANLKRKSALSRLQDVAESMYMLFTSSRATSQGDKDIDSDTNSVGAYLDESARRYPHLPINDVTKTICTSSKIAMSELEARQSITILRDLAPGFVEINKVGAREWVRMGSTVEGEDVQIRSGGVLGAVRRRIRKEIERGG